MNPSRYIHSVTGERRQTTQTGGKQDRAWVPTNSGAAISVLVEGLTSRQRVALIHIKQAQYTMTWSGDIQEGDRVTYSGHVYIVSDVIDDTTRPTGPYKTGILSRKPFDA